MDENPYDILGVSRDASLDEVKKAYRKKARENHPDLNPGDDQAAARMNKINEAYDRIINPEKYAREDARKGAYGGYGSAGGAGGAGAGAGGYGTGTGSTGYGTGGYGTDGYGGAGGYGTGGSGYGGSGYGGDYEENNPYGGGGYQWTTVSWADLFGGYGQTGPIHPEASASDSPDVRQAINEINSGAYDAAARRLENIPSTGRDARWYYLAALANNGAGNSVRALEQIRRARQMDPQNPDYQRAERSFTQRAQSYQQESTTRGFSMGFMNPGMLMCLCVLCSTSFRPCLYLYCI